MQHDEITGPGGDERRMPSRRRRVLSATALAAGLALGGVGIAAATTAPSPSPSPTGSSSASPSPSTAPDGGASRDGHRGRHHGFGGGEFGREFGGVGGAPLHGQFVTPDGNGGYRTLEMQRGTVTEVSDTALTVKSEDGYAKTYTVTADTLVNAARDGISPVKVDATVSVVAVVEDDATRAVRVVDTSRLREWRQEWAPRSDDNGQGSTGGSSTAESSARV